MNTLGVLQFPLLHRGHVEKEDYFPASSNQVPKCASGLGQTDCKTFGLKIKTKFHQLVRVETTPHSCQEVATSLFHCHHISFLNFFSIPYRARATQFALPGPGNLRIMKRFGHIHWNSSGHKSQWHSVVQFDTLDRGMVFLKKKVTET